MPDNILIPAPRSSFIDERSGNISREWYLFFLELWRRGGGGGDSLTAEDIAQFPIDSGDQLELLAERVMAVESDSQILTAQLDSVQSQVDELSLIPPDVVVPSVAPAYGSFYDSSTQTIAVINTAYPIVLGSALIASDVALGTPTSRVVVSKTGVYAISVVLQVTNTAVPITTITFVLRLNGGGVSSGAQTMQIAGTGRDGPVSLSYLQSASAGDYFDVTWSSNTLNPSLASARFNIQQVI